MSEIDLKRRLQIAGKSQNDLADYLRVSISSTSRLVRGERKMTVEESRLIDEWLAGSGETVANSALGRIPIFGYAAANNGNLIAFSADKAIDWIDPPPLANIPGPMAGLRVIGSSMEPRYFAGEVAIIALNLPPARGKDCVIEFKDGSADIKTYERSKDGFVFCRQWNDEREIRYSATEIRELHAVVSRQ